MGDYTPHQEQYMMLRLPQLKEILGISRSSIYLQVGQGLLTQPISMGSRAIAWPKFEIMQILAARIRGDDDFAIREVVLQLHKGRCQIFL